MLNECQLVNRKKKKKMKERKKKNKWIHTHTQLRIGFWNRTKQSTLAKSLEHYKSKAWEYISYLVYIIYSTTCMI